MICDNTMCTYWTGFNSDCKASDGCAGFSSLIANNQAVIDDMGIVCSDSKVGSHMCNVKTRLGWCCDVCIEPELLYLHNIGIHTVNSCCGHGEKKYATIIVVGQSSINKMRGLGYDYAGIEWDVKPERPSAVFLAKTVFPYENGGAE